mgnify:CR=1 FL=1
MALTKIKTSGIEDDAVNADKIADGAINHTPMLSNDVVNQDKIADNAVGLDQLAGGTDGQIISWDASGDPLAVGPGTDGQVLTSTGAGSPPAFEAIPAQTPEGTAVLSTGESGGTKFLREDGDGTSSWQTVSVPAGVGGSTGVDFNDSVKARFGTGNDLEIYHNASHSIIHDNGVGDLKIIGDDVIIQAGNDDTMAKFIEDGTVELYHNNSKKIETTSVGATVTGNVKSGGVTLQTKWDSDVTYGTSRAGGAGFGDTNLGPVSITPKFSTSKMQVQAGIQYVLNDGGSGNNWGALAVYRSNDGGSNWSQVTFGPRDSNGVFLVGIGTGTTIRGYYQINFNTDASQTTEVQFKLMMNKYQDGTIVVNETSNDVQRCWMSVREYTD